MARAPRVLLAAPLFLTGVLLVLMWRWFGHGKLPEPVETLSLGEPPAGAPAVSEASGDRLDDTGPEPAAGRPPGEPGGRSPPSASSGDRTRAPASKARVPPPLAWPLKKSSKSGPSRPPKALLSPKSFTEPALREEGVPPRGRSDPAPGKKPGGPSSRAESRSVLAGLPKRIPGAPRLPSASEMAGIGRQYAEFQEALAAYRKGDSLSAHHKRVLRAAEADSIREAERIIRQAVSTQPVEDGPSGPLARGKTWPVDGKVTQEFGPNDFSLNGPKTYKGTYYPHFHSGMDIAAPMGAPIRALDAGRVAHVGHSSGLGMHVIVIHPEGLATTYGHMDTGSRGPRVRAGDRVAAGQVLGYIGMTGLTTGPHTHFMTHKGDLINPRHVLP